VEKGYDPLGVLISGRGSNLQALIDAHAADRLGARLALVISNRDEARGLARAQAAGIESLVMPHGEYRSREAYDQALAATLHSRGVRLVCLAGFMRRLGGVFCDAFPNAVLNVHPSLLPAFPGLDAVRQALTHGVKVSGATVHLVTAELDAGPIVIQGAVPVKEDDTAETLAARILDVEHTIYPEAVRLIASGRWRLDGRRVIFDAGEGAAVESDPRRRTF
jgi:phosphoribosylglycinamide formyltransferase-1